MTENAEKKNDLQIEKRSFITEIHRDKHRAQGEENILLDFYR